MEPQSIRFFEKHAMGASGRKHEHGSADRGVGAMGRKAEPKVLEPSAQEAKSRRVLIKRDDAEKYGMTPNCQDDSPRWSRGVKRIAEEMKKMMEEGVEIQEPGSMSQEPSAPSGVERDAEGAIVE